MKIEYINPQPWNTSERYRVLFWFLAVSKDSAGVKFFTGDHRWISFITAFRVSQLIIIIWVDAEILNFSGTEFATCIDIACGMICFTANQFFSSDFKLLRVGQLGWKKYPCRLKTPLWWVRMKRPQIRTMTIHCCLLSLSLYSLNG